VLGFALFRFFDILKPWPIRWFDRNVHGGLGIMLDDVMAAIPAAAILYIVMLILKQGGT
jgi:phosphatidylglycerophosphatase A